MSSKFDHKSLIGKISIQYLLYLKKNFLYLVYFISKIINFIKNNIRVIFIIILKSSKFCNIYFIFKKILIKTFKFVIKNVYYGIFCTK